MSKIDVANWICCLALSPSRAVVAVGSSVASSGGILSLFTSSPSIFLYNLADASQTAVLAGHTELVTSLAFHPRVENILVSGSEDNSIRIWNVAEKSCLRVIRRHTNWVNSIALVPSTGYFLGSPSDEASEEEEKKEE